MAAIFSDNDIDFAAYEKETDAKQKVKTAGSYIQELIDRIHNPVRAIHSFMPWRKTQNIVQFRPGEVTLWMGANGHGKSMVTGMVGLGLCAQEEKVAIASFEMKPIKTLERMGRQYSGSNPDNPAFVDSESGKRLLLDLYEDFKDWTDNRLWLYDQQGTVTQQQVIAVTRYCVKELGVTHMFIDSMMKCVQGEDDYNGQKNFVDELTSLARDTSVHIHLIHHIKKPPSDEHKPTKYDAKGSGAITDQVDNVMIVWRNKPKEKKRGEGLLTDEADAKEPDCLIICDKQRNGEWEGQIGLWFDKESQQYLPSHGDTPQDMHANPKEFLY